MDMARLTELLQVRLIELGIAADDDVSAELARERAYVLAFCGVAELDEDLSAICVELAAAAILERLAAADKAALKNISMGDVSIGYAQSEAATKKYLAEGIYRKAIAALAAKRGIKW